MVCWCWCVWVCVCVFAEPHRGPLILGLQAWLLKSRRRILCDSGEGPTADDQRTRVVCRTLTSKAASTCTNERVILC